MVNSKYEQNDNNNVLEIRKHISIDYIITNGMTDDIPSTDTEFIQKNFIDGVFVSGETNVIFKATMQKNSGIS